jgi:RNA polymerase sigma factor (TIGR02999 family)
MTQPSSHDLTGLLQAWSSGDPEALQRLFPLIYNELRALAADSLRHERPDHTLQPTALVHEAYLRLLPRESVSAPDRSQFMAVAAQAIRRVLVDHGRGRRRAKRGGDRVRVTLTGAAARQEPLDLDILDLDRALQRLGENDRMDQRVVELKFFGGLSDVEAAAVLGCSERTVRRRWSYSRAWLFRELQGGAPS